MRSVLLDESIPASVGQWLAAAGHDVVSIATATPGIDDRRVLALARKDRRWLLTFDADFGGLLFQKGEPPPPAVLFFRVHPIAAAEVLALALRALDEDAGNCFVVVTREGMRKRPFGAAGDDSRS